MKYIAIVELPDDAPDWGDGKWKIDDEGAIRYLEDDTAWMHYKFIDDDGLELKPLPKKDPECRYFDECELAYKEGWNAGLDEITGGTDEISINS